MGQIKIQIPIHKRVTGILIGRGWGRGMGAGDSVERARAQGITGEWGGGGIGYSSKAHAQKVDGGCKTMKGNLELAGC